LRRAQVPEIIDRPPAPSPRDQHVDGSALDLRTAHGSLPAVASAVRRAALDARAHASIAAGTTAFVHVHLPRSAEHKLRAAHVLRVRALLSVHGTLASVATSHYSLTLKPARAKRH